MAYVVTGSLFVIENENVEAAFEEIEVDASPFFNTLQAFLIGFVVVGGFNVLVTICMVAAISKEKLSLFIVVS